MVGESDVRSRKRELIRAEIVAAAWELARRDGVAALSLRELAARVGMRAPSLYTYFATKNDLYDRMYAEGMREFAERIRAAPAGASPREALRNRTRAFVDAAMEDPRRFELLFQRPVPDFVPSADTVAAAMAGLAETAQLARAAGLPDQRAFDLHMGTVRGLVSLQIANEPGGDRWVRLIDDAVDIYVDHYTGASPKPAPPDAEHA